MIVTKRLAAMVALTAVFALLVAACGRQREVPPVLVARPRSCRLTQAAGSAIVKQIERCRSVEF